MKPLLLLLCVLPTALFAKTSRFDERFAMEFEKNGEKIDCQIRWQGKSPDDPDGRLYFEQVRKVGVDTADTFDVGFRPRIAARLSLDLPKRNILVLRQGGVGSPGGDTIHVFSSANGSLYRVHFVDGEASWPFIFTEHYSAGSPSMIRFIDAGRTVRTLKSSDSQANKRVITEFSWDGTGYRKIKSFECLETECPAMTD